MEKLTRAAAGYVSPGSKPNLFAQCAECKLYLPKRKLCAIHGKDVKVAPTASCIYFIPGPPDDEQPVTRAYAPGDTRLSDGLVQCHRCDFYNPKRSRCQHFDMLNHLMPETWDADPDVEEHGCCNFWSD